MADFTTIAECLVDVDITISELPGGYLVVVPDTVMIQEDDGSVSESYKCNRHVFTDTQTMFHFIESQLTFLKRSRLESESADSQIKR